MKHASHFPLKELGRRAWICGFFMLFLSAPVVVAQTNLALKKPASQSSTWSSAYPAASCVDGITGSICATNQEANPWWQVDLQGNYALSEIVVTNRTDCCSERSRTLTALLSSDGRNWSRIYAHDGSDFKTLRINAGGRTARYVRLQQTSTDYMNLEEVEVYGGQGATPPVPLPPLQNEINLALKKPASQSSTWSSAYPAASCVDGITGSICATNQEANPWWQVDLQGNYALSEIVVTNRTDCCSERSRTLTALLSSDGRNWSRIYAHDGSDFKTLQIKAGGRTARYVRLQQTSTDYLNLEEVEVYGVGSPNPPPPPPPPPLTGAAVRYRVENLVYNMPDIYTNPRNLHDFVVDFTNCTIRNLSQQADEGRVSIKVLVCRDKRRLTFTVSSGGAMVEYDWVFRDNGRIIAGVWRQGTGFGPSVGAIFDMNSGWDVR